jgi:hypothetical protein
VFQVAGSSNSWNGSTGILFSCYANYSGTFYWQWNSGGATYQITGTGAPTNQWCHVAVGYNGSTTRVWINGSSIGTSGSGYTIPSYSKVSIGNNCVGSGDSNLSGYMSDVRFIKGTDIYGVGNSTITVPTAPLTPITNTQLLTNFTNAGIPDLAMMNNLETVGNAQVSTSVKKYGTGSLAFDGTGDYLITSPNQTLNFRNGDFTIEGWVYTTNTSSTFPFVQCAPAVGRNGVVMGWYNSTQFWWLFGDGSNWVFERKPSGTVSTSTWFYMTVVRDNGTARFYIDGVQIDSIANTTNLSQQTNNTSYIGGNPDGYTLTGYMDDFRVTNGLCRYPNGTTFTPPTAALPTY